MLISFLLKQDILFFVIFKTSIDPERELTLIRWIDCALALIKYSHPLKVHAYHECFWFIYHRSEISNPIYPHIIAYGASSI